MRGLRIALVLCMLVGLPGVARAAGDLVVFAAASLESAFAKIGDAYRTRYGVAVRFSFAGSGALARQIEHGAPATIFVSADEKWMDYLEQRRLIVAPTRRTVLGNRLVLVVPAAKARSVELKRGFEFAALLGADGRWVTGDPDSVPAGRYAQQALTSLGVWAYARTRLVRAENVRVALAFVERGEAAAGVVYETDAMLSSKVQVAGVFPESSHTPVTYPAAVVEGRDGPRAREFLRFLESPEAASILRGFGFSVR